MTAMHCSQAVSQQLHLIMHHIIRLTGYWAIRLTDYWANGRTD